MALRELLLKLGVEVDKQGEQSALSGLEKLKAAAKLAAGAFAAFKGVQAVTGMANEIRGLADEIDKTSQQLGLSAQALEEFRHAANLSGVDGRAMSDTLGKLQKNAFEAATGNKTLAEDFARLGVNVKDANGEVKTAEVLLMEMADGFSQMDNETEKVGLSLGLMGRAGRKLLPMLNAGADGIQAMRDEAKELGGVFGDELIKQSVQLTDDQARLEFAFRGLKAMVASQVMPAMIEVTQWFIKLAVTVRGPLQRGLRFLGRIFKGFSMVVDFLNEKMEGLGTALAFVAGGAGLLGAAFLLLGKKAVFAALKTAAAWIIANAPLLLMIALVGIIIGAILLLIEDLVTLGEGGESVIGGLIEYFSDLWDSVANGAEFIKEILFNTFNFWFDMSRETFDKIIGNLIDFIAMLIAPFQAAVTFIINLFMSIWDFVRDVFTVGLGEAFSNLWTNIGSAASQLVDDIIAYFKDLFSFVEKGWNAVKDFFGFGDDEEEPAPAGLSPSPRKAAKGIVDAETARLRARMPVQETTRTLTQVAQPGGNVAGVSAAQALPPAASAGAGNSIVNQPTTSVEVSVDASNAGSPDEVGSAVAREVDAALARRDRQTMQAFTTAMGTT